MCDYVIEPWIQSLSLPLERQRTIQQQRTVHYINFYKLSVLAGLGHPLILGLFLNFGVAWLPFADYMYVSDNKHSPPTRDKRARVASIRHHLLAAASQSVLLRRQHEYSARSNTLLLSDVPTRNNRAHPGQSLVVPSPPRVCHCYHVFSRAFTYPICQAPKLVFELIWVHHPIFKAQSLTSFSMPPSPSVPSSQSSPIETETAHDRSPVAAETPEQPQPGAPSSPPRLSGFQGPANLESLLDDLDRRMAENTTSNDTRSPTTRRVTNNRVRVRAAGPNPVVVAPSAPRVVVPPTPTGGNQQRLTIAGRILVFFGYGRNNRARKELVSLICSLVIDTSQVSI